MDYLYAIKPNFYAPKFIVKSYTLNPSNYQIFAEYADEIEKLEIYSSDEFNISVTFNSVHELLSG
jgi:hypothetical protein